MSVLVDGLKARESIQVDASHKHTIGKDLAQTYVNVNLCDCTIAVPKANRKFKASSSTKKKDNFQK